MSNLVLMGDPAVAAIEVVESGDELVDARELGFRSTPDQNPQNAAYAFLRSTVAQRLLRAQDVLPPGLHLLIAEGYRPYEQQEFSFNRRVRRLMAADPMLSDEDALLRASEVVSPPHVAPHVSGAAVDLTLVDDRGRPLDLGTAIDATPEESHGACYFAADNVSADARSNRTVLAAALSSAGLVNYPTEWWHWSYGDRYWALVTGHPHALFGPVQMSTPERAAARRTDRPGA